MHDGFVVRGWLELKGELAAAGEGGERGEALPNFREFQQF
jgi:hypothetical protein